jgi:uncharacterized repeat protein (TIGR01451 family)
VNVVSLDQTDTDPGNNSHSIPINIRQTNIGIFAEPSIDNPQEGDTITYIITVSNYGPSSANGIVVDVSLPSQVTYVSHVAGQGSANTNTWNVGSLANGSNTTLVIEVTINAGTANTTISYPVTVTAVNEDDSESGDDSFTTDLNVLP